MGVLNDDKCVAWNNVQIASWCFPLKDPRDESSVVSKIVMMTCVSDLNKKKHFVSVTPPMTVWDVSIKARKWDHELDVGSICQLNKLLLIMTSLKKGRGHFELNKGQQKKQLSAYF